MSQLFKFPTTYQEFLNEYPPEDNDIIFASIQTIRDSVCEKRTTLKDLEETYSIEDAVDYIDLWLKALNDYLNIKEPLTATARVAFKLYNNFSHFHLTDLKLVHDKIVFGRGVKFYTTVDAQAICKAYEDFDKERRLVIYELENFKPDTPKIRKQERTLNVEEIGAVMKKIRAGLGKKDEQKR